MRLITTLLAVLLMLPLINAQDPSKRPTSRPVKKPTSRPAKSVANRKMGLAKPLVFEHDKEVYGNELKGKKRVALKTVAKNRDAWNNKEIQVTGKIMSVCPKKGCWIMVKDGEEELRVKFKDYSFFMPLDCAGQTMTAEGKVTVRVEKEGERRHYAEDAGKSKEEIMKIKGDKVILSFMADAVQIGTPPKVKKAQHKGEHKHDGEHGHDHEHEKKSEHEHGKKKG